MSAIHLKTEIPHPQDVIDYASFAKFEARSMHGQLPIIWKKAKGCNVWDKYGNKFLDFTSGIAVTNVGHGNDEIIRGIQTMIEKPLLHSYTFATDIRYWFLRELIETCYPKGKAFLVSAGTEATEVACKLMRMYGLTKAYYKNVIISFKGAMHGRTMLAEQLRGITENNKWAECHFLDCEGADFLSTIINLDWEEKLDVVKEHKSRICGIIIESYQGWSAKFFKPSYMQELVQWAHDNDILVCFDEIQGGFGRTGKMFAFEHYNLPYYPDLICIGKGVSCSLPLSGVIGRADILDIPAVGSMSSTHSANPMSCIAGLKTLLEIRRHDLINRSDEMGDKLHSFLDEHFGKKYEINGRGLLAGIVTKTEEEATDIVWKCFKKGLLLIWTHKNSVKLAPPLTITEDELIEGLGILYGVLLMR